MTGVSVVYFGLHWPHGTERGMPKPVPDLTDDELREAWEDGNWLASQAILTPEQEQLLQEVEREMSRRGGQSS